MTVAPQPTRLLPMEDIEDMTGLSRRMIYRLIADGRFPKQYKPGGWSSRWSEAEVRDWVEQQRGAA
ncbi:MULTISPECIES: AlpA family transcriptional regulator [unclassified Novosphingobium]|uniref:helix-turn-helix transcriptional regulator n=1 Tax=unclassified Novosphingobium TaxID=2644732 RepID=UPI001358E245|nr:MULTISPECIES: AlpA family phage regulatory protein [unclassified Novosphingobium]